MLDYRGIEALYTVLKLQSFAKAAEKLHITQSAVSQRIKALEDAYSEKVLVRHFPYALTSLGRSLMGVHQQLCLLEESFKEEVLTTQERPHLAISINRDSLETWFLDLLEKTEIFNKMTLEILAADQEETINFFKNGVVSACLSTYNQPIQGSKSIFLGDMEYILVASPQFVKKHSLHKVENLKKSTIIKFDRQDNLQDRFLEKYFSISSREFAAHYIPSIRAFKKYAILGYGYCLIPKLDVIEELKSKKLVWLHKDKTWKMPLYWHCWSLQAKFYQNFNRGIIKFVKSYLKEQQTV